MGAGIKESGHFRQRVGEATINLVKHATIVYIHYYTPSNLLFQGISAAGFGKTRTFVKNA
jgi:hypothetical protein